MPTYHCISSQGTSIEIDGVVGRWGHYLQTYSIISCDWFMPSYKPKPKSCVSWVGWGQCIILERVNWDPLFKSNEIHAEGSTCCACWQ